MRDRRVELGDARDGLESLVQAASNGVATGILRDRQPAAALVPVHVYDRWRAERVELFRVIAEVQAQNAEAAPDVVMRDVLVAQQAVRRDASHADG